MPECDVLVSSHGSICLIKPMTEAAQAWVEEHLESDETQHWCGAVVVEPRYLDPIVDGMLGDGLTVEPGT
jgi:hypothetical protein